MSIRVSVGQAGLRSTKNTPLKPSALKKTGAQSFLKPVGKSTPAPKVELKKTELKKVEPKKVEAKVEPPKVVEQPKQEPPKVAEQPKPEPPKVAEPPKPEPPKVTEPSKPEPPKEAPAPKVEVKIQKAPKFKESLKNAKVTAGSTVIIDCVCEGEPEPDVDWFKDGTLIKDEERFRYLYEKGDIIGLEIKKTIIQDEGEYKCVAFNQSGKAECKCEILVDGI